MLTAVDPMKPPPILVSPSRPMLTLDHIRGGVDHLGYPIETVTVSHLAIITRLSAQTIRNDIDAGALVALPGRRKGEGREKKLVALAEAQRYLRMIGILE